MTEPSYIRLAEQDPALHRGWFESCSREAKVDGCTFGRFTVHPNNERMALVEGWIDKPDNQGEPRFAEALRMKQYTASEIVASWKSDVDA